MQNQNVNQGSIIPGLQASDQKALLEKYKHQEELSAAREQEKNSGDYYEDVVPKEVTPQIQQPRPVQHVAREIEELDKELITQPAQSKRQSTFLDPDTGEETFYVKNVSNGHVVIEDLEVERVPVGGCVDLLEYLDITDVKKSRELRKAINGKQGTQLLKRLTPEEWEQEVDRSYVNRQKIEHYKKQAEIRAQSGLATPTMEKVRGVVKAKLEKLRLGTESDTPSAGITPVEFMTWVGSYDITINELDYILGATTDQDIRLFVLERKKQLQAQ